MPGVCKSCRAFEPVRQECASNPASMKSWNVVLHKSRDEGNLPMSMTEILESQAWKIELGALGVASRGLQSNRRRYRRFAPSRVKSNTRRERYPGGYLVLIK